MGKKHQVSHLVSDLTKGTAAPGVGSVNAKAAVHSSHPTSEKSNHQQPKTSYRKQQKDLSSSDDEEENAVQTTNPPSSARSSVVSKGYIAVPKATPTATTGKLDLGTKRAREEVASSAAHASTKPISKSSVVETLTISSGKNATSAKAPLTKKVVQAAAATEPSDDDSDDDDDNISLDSFDAEQMAAPKKGTFTKVAGKKGHQEAMAVPPAQADDEEDDDDDDLFGGEEGAEEESEWDEEDLEALMAMGDDSDEEFEEGLEMEEEDEEDDMSDMPSDDEEGEEEDYDDDDYNELAKEVKKTKGVNSGNGKNANPNKKDDSVVVNFDAFGFESTDVDQTIHLLDNFIPDTMNQVDRDELGALLMAEPTTMIIKQGERDSDDDDGSDASDDDDSEDSEKENDGPELNNDADDVFAIYSLLPISASLLSGAQKDLASKTSATAKALSGVLQTPWNSLQKATTTVSQLLVGQGKAESPVLVLLMDHIKTVPIDVTLAAIDNIVSDAEGNAADARYTSKQLVNAKIVCLAKIQRNAEKDNDRSTSKSLSKLKPPGAPGANNNKKRISQISSSKVEKDDVAEDEADESCPLDFMEAAVNAAEADKRSKEDKKKERQATAAENNGFQLSDYVFWRPFEESLYDRRDPTVAVSAYKCRAQYDEQPDNDRPISVAFAVTWNGLKQAVTSVRNLAIPSVPSF